MIVKRGRILQGAQQGSYLVSIRCVCSKEKHWKGPVLPTVDTVVECEFDSSGQPIAVRPVANSSVAVITLQADEPIAPAEPVALAAFTKQGRIASVSPADDIEISIELPFSTGAHWRSESAPDVGRGAECTLTTSGELQSVAHAPMVQLRRGRLAIDCESACNFDPY